MKVFAKLYCLIPVSLLAGGFFCHAEETAQWGGLISPSIKIEAVLLEYKVPSNNKNGILLVERTAHVSLNKNQTSLIKKLFNTATNYAPVTTDCDPQYGARLIFHFGKSPNNTNDIPKILQLNFCFSCGHMRGELDGKSLAGKYDGFQPMRGSLLNLFKELFPKESPLAVWPK